MLFVEQKDKFNKNETELKMKILTNSFREVNCMLQLV